MILVRDQGTQGDDACSSRATTETGTMALMMVVQTSARRLWLGERVKEGQRNERMNGG